MAMLPALIISVWLGGLLSFGIIGAGIYLIYEWYRRAWAYNPQLDRYDFTLNLGFNLPTALLAASVLLLVWAVAGGVIVRLLAGLMRRSQAAGDTPEYTREGVVHRLPRPDGSELQVECYGPEDGQPIILTHGWGANSTEWYYLKRQLTDRCRLIVWDLPGLGLSTRPANNDYSLTNLAHDLDAVLGLAGDRPALLLGHSIGGMIILTFCQLFPTALGTRVAGLVLVHTTYTNPVRTTKLAGLTTALERPVIVPLLHLTIWLSPLVWLMNWLSYLNGTAYLSTKSGGFAGTETWEQVEFITGFQPHAPPAVVARGMLGMLGYDATTTLPSIEVPTMVISGDRDASCAPQASARIHQDVPASQLVPLSPAKHMGLIEHNQRFAEVVREFAANCFQATRPHQPIERTV